jgi:hypothetical protein
MATGKGDSIVVLYGGSEGGESEKSRWEETLDNSEALAL